MKTWFEQNAKWTLIFLVSIMAVIGFYTLEYSARAFGLGTVAVYHSNPIYGYRLNPNQSIKRFNQSLIHVNNLGLRAQSDWDLTHPENKVLFLGDSVTYGGSYISNEQLFSELAVQNTPWQAGNAGVNAWGILNIHGLIKELEFLPAQIYITVVPEGDFYRGINRIGGQPFWTRQPILALEELFQYGIYQIALKKTPGLNPNTLSMPIQLQTIDIATRALKDIDNHLKAKGFQHYIFISPSRSQALKGAPINQDIKTALENHQLNAIYLLDEMNRLQGDKSPLFHDEIHLSAAGHKQWAIWIRSKVFSIDKT